MFFENSMLLYGENIEYILFKTAIDIAETGLNVWFVTPESFSKVPENIIPPSKDVLKLITFLYLKDDKDLISQLNGIHMWHTVPHCIIINCFDYYNNLQNNEDMDIVRSSFLLSSMLDALCFCTKKHLQRTFLLVALSDDRHFNIDKFKTLFDLYLGSISVSHENNSSVIISKVISFFNK